MLRIKNLLLVGALTIGAGQVQAMGYLEQAKELAPEYIARAKDLAKKVDKRVAYSLGAGVTLFTLYKTAQAVKNFGQKAQDSKLSDEQSLVKQTISTAGFAPVIEPVSVTEKQADAPVASVIEVDSEKSKEVVDTGKQADAAKVDAPVTSVVEVGVVEVGLNSSEKESSKEVEKPSLVRTLTNQWEHTTAEFKARSEATENAQAQMQSARNKYQRSKSVPANSVNLTAVQTSSPAPVKPELRQTKSLATIKSPAQTDREFDAWLSKLHKIHRANVLFLINEITSQTNGINNVQLLKEGFMKNYKPEPTGHIE